MQLQIKNQSFAQRCEVCHQSDCYDSEKNHCSRCFKTVAIHTKAFVFREMGFWGQLVFFIITSVTLMFLLAMGEVYSSFASRSKEALLGSFLAVMFIGLSWFIIKVIWMMFNWLFLEISSLFKRN
ncbi:MAG: hypothetical protein HY819_09395 [Acidobacteria bacterium]|nr:hypothetical protein [Acidobacteriota bacterium]